MKKVQVEESATRKKRNRNRNRVQHGKSATWTKYSDSKIWKKVQMKSALLCTKE